MLSRRSKKKSAKKEFTAVNEKIIKIFGKDLLDGLQGVKEVGFVGRKFEEIEEINLFSNIGIARSAPKRIRKKRRKQ